MRLTNLAVALLATALSGFSWAGDQKVEAAAGGAVGGAVGAVVGEELGDRKGAIVGAAIGAAVGTAVATDDGKADAVHVHHAPVEVQVDVSAGGHPHGRHCPPGQAKKGRC